MIDHMNEQNHEDLECLQDYVKAVLGDTPSEDWCQAARHRLQSLLESKKKENWIMNMIKNGQKGKLKWAVAVAALAVVAILAGTIPKVGETGLAFAQVVQRIQQIQTLTYQIRGAIPQRRFYKAPHLGRWEFTVTGGVLTVDTQARKLLQTSPETKTYYYEENIDPRWPVNVLDRIAEIKTGTVETLPEKELAGHKVVGFKAPLLDIFKTPLPKDRATMVTIWAEAATGDPVQVEFDHADGDTTVWSDFQFNVPLDDALFSLTPPEGYTFKAR